MSLDEFYAQNISTINYLLRFTTYSKEGSHRSDAESLVRLEGDPRFKKLADAFNRPNPFTIMGRLTDEVPHSNVLAYFATPRESHGFGTEVLFALCPVFGGSLTEEPSRPENIIVLREHILDDFDGVSEIEAEEMEEGKAKKSRKKAGRPDLILYDPTQRRAAVLELKVRSQEGSGQRDRYFAWAKKFFSSYHDDNISWRCSFLYITQKPDTPPHILSGQSNRDIITIDVGGPVQCDTPSVHAWTSMNYGDVSRLLEPFSSMANSGENRPGQNLIDDYLGFLSQHICPMQGAYATDAKALVQDHAGILAAFDDHRMELKRKVIRALEPDFLKLGFKIIGGIDKKLKPNQSQTITLDYVRNADGKPSGWPSDIDELTWNFSIFGAAKETAAMAFHIPSLGANLRMPDFEKREKWVGRLGHTIKRDGKERALTLNVPLPIQERPYPLTAENSAFLIEYLRTHLCRRLKWHVERVKS